MRTIKASDAAKAKVNGKVAFITGGNRGLGLETARELGKQGIFVVLDHVIRRKAKAQPRNFATKELPQKAWASMLTNRKIIRRLTITSRKITAGWIFWLTTRAS